MRDEEDRAAPANPRSSPVSSALWNETRAKKLTHLEEDVEGHVHQLREGTKNRKTSPLALRDRDEFRRTVSVSFIQTGAFSRYS